MANEGLTKPDICGYCGEGGTDHNHADGTRCCGDCCAIHGGLVESDQPAYDLMSKMHLRLLRAQNELAEANKKIERLESTLVQVAKDITK